MNINYIYNTLMEMGLARSQCDFSRTWLGRSRRYYSYLLATDKAPPLDIRVGLATRLEIVADILRGAGHDRAAGELQAIATAMWAEVRRGSVKGPPSHKKMESSLEAGRTATGAAG